MYGHGGNQRTKVVNVYGHGGNQRFISLSVTVRSLGMMNTNFIISSVNRTYVCMYVFPYLSIISVRQEHYKRALIVPLVLPTSDEIIDYRLGHIRKIAELCLPYRQGHLVVAVGKSGD